MKIGQVEHNAAVGTNATERKPGSAASGAGAHAEPSAKVELSSAVMAGSADPVFDAEKVQRISDAIRDGKMVINAEAIADKLIANAQELLIPGGKA